MQQYFNFTAAAVSSLVNILLSGAPAANRPGVLTSPLAFRVRVHPSPHLLAAFALRPGG